MPARCSACNLALNRASSPSVQCRSCRLLYHKSCADPSGTVDLRSYTCCSTPASLFATPPPGNLFPRSNVTNSGKRPIVSPPSPTANPARRIRLEDTPTTMSNHSVPMETANGPAQQFPSAANLQAANDHVGGPRQDGPPPGFYERLEAFMTQSTRTSQELLENSRRHSEALSAVTSRVEALEVRDAQTNTRIDQLLDTITTRDTCELRFSDIPADLTQSPYQIISAILTALGLPKITS